MNPLHLDFKNFRRPASVSRGLCVFTTQHNTTQHNTTQKRNSTQPNVFMVNTLKACAFTVTLNLLIVTSKLHIVTT